ncbi:3-oxoacyl-ACP synthase [Spirochaetia bacterium]|nr:3-oxoacyl-ACP synthase [Spirochaetia bacterium]
MTTLLGCKKEEPQKTLYVSRFSSWAPGLTNSAEWTEWAKGDRAISADNSSPGLEFTDPLFRRRLSQISRMTIQVIRDLMPLGEKTKIVFLSFRGEISQQFKINKMLIEEHALLPAAFSHSVFNTPPALAAIALNLRAGYTAIYPGSISGESGDERRFTSGFLAAAAPILCNSAAEIALVYADEQCPPEYGSLCPCVNEALAFGAVLSLKNEGRAIPVQSPYKPGRPQDFLKYLYLYKASHGAS